MSSRRLIISNRVEKISNLFANLEFNALFGVLEQLRIESILRNVDTPPFESLLSEEQPLGLAWLAVRAQATFTSAKHHFGDGVVEINPHSAEAADGASVARMYPNRRSRCGDLELISELGIACQFVRPLSRGCLCPVPAFELASWLLPPSGRLFAVERLKANVTSILHSSHLDLRSHEHPQVRRECGAAVMSNIKAVVVTRQTCGILQQRNHDLVALSSEHEELQRM
jgi:hypothetical protein